MTSKKESIYFKEMAKRYQQCAETQRLIDDFERKNKVLVDKYVPIGYLELPHKIPNIISVSAKNKKRFALENVLKDETQLKKEKNKNKAKTNKNDVKESIMVAE